MKTLGIIGGLSWESTALYYQGINRLIAEKHGGLSSAKILMSSLNFAEVAPLIRKNRWEELAEVLLEEARNLERAGSDILIMTSNTVHKVAPYIEQHTFIPFLHIVDATLEKLPKGTKKIGLVGTFQTMSDGFYQERGAEQGFEVFAPKAQDARREIDRIIFDELCRGQVKPNSCKRLFDEANALIHNGAEAIILGCTELILAFDGQGFEVPVLDSAKCHMQATALSIA